MPVKYFHMAGGIRFYAEGKSYEHRDAFEGVVSVVWLNAHTALLKAANGKAGATHLQEAIDELQPLGATVFRCERAKNHHMPKPWRLVEIGKLEDVWELTL